MYIVVCLTVNSICEWVIKTLGFTDNLYPNWWINCNRVQGYGFTGVVRYGLPWKTPGSVVIPSIGYSRLVAAANRAAAATAAAMENIDQLS